ncbi:hypothetical protein TNCT1_15060 [Streptomyces sp. 1-11]|nr:hypothetical protein TNCT1_15060 [Streptomyces sp. 1-11]
MNSRPSERVGITVQRSGKSCGSWSKTVDGSVVVNIAVTHTGDICSGFSDTPAKLPQSSLTATFRDRAEA